jgi:hypothetical protein
VRKLIVLAVLVWLAGCALTPEARLVQGYKTVSASARTATVLTNRDAISVKDAESVLSMGWTTKSILDSGKEKLKACREAQARGEAVDCNKAFSNINLGVGVLGELERYLEANQ